MTAPDTHSNKNSGKQSKTTERAEKDDRLAFDGGEGGEAALSGESREQQPGAAAIKAPGNAPMPEGRARKMRDPKTGE